MRSIPTDETLKKICKVLKCKRTDLIPEMTEDELNTIIEVREYNEPGMKLLIARVPLPAGYAHEIAGALEERAAHNGKKR